ncbi:MAG: hypothetical protein AAFR64_10510, partial [Pseudomonadota bacterium]
SRKVSHRNQIIFADRVLPSLSDIGAELTTFKEACNLGVAIGGILDRGHNTLGHKKQISRDPGTVQNDLAALCGDWFELAPDCLAIAMVQYVTARADMLFKDCETGRWHSRSFKKWGIWKR